MDREIGEIGSFYGKISVKEEDGKFYWSIEDWNGNGWREIPEYLYAALNKHQDELDI